MTLLAGAAVGTANAGTVLILGAVPQELASIQQALGERRADSVNGIHCDAGTLGPRQVVVALTGIGKTDAAMTATALVQHYSPSAVFWTGTAARVRQSLRVGDVIVATKVMHYDVGRETPGGTLYDFYGYAKNADVKPTDRPMVISKDVHSTESAFACDPALLAFAQAFLKGYHPEPVAALGPPYVPQVRTGFIVAGDLATLTNDRIAEIRRNVDPDLLEMEAGAVAQVCTFFHVPFLIICGGSDLLKEDNPGDYALLSPIAARQAARFTQSLVAALP